MSEVTQVLNSIEQGQAQAVDLMPLVYEELRKLAAARMSNEPPGQTLQATALVHEAWLRLVDQDGRARFNSRAHFFGAAAEAMRRILIERARRKQALRHGAGKEHVDVTEVEIAVEAGGEELLAVNDALVKFAARDPLKAELVKLRYFVGLTLAETANIMGISEPTVKRHWAFARAWLQAEITATKSFSRLNQS